MPATGDYFYFESSSGDYIGQGRTELYTSTDSTLTPDWFSNTLQFFVDEIATDSNWRAEFDGRLNQAQLEPGLYEDVQRYPFHNPAKGGMTIAG